MRYSEPSSLIRPDFVASWPQLAGTGQFTSGKCDSQNHDQSVHEIRDIKTRIEMINVGTEVTLTHRGRVMYICVQIMACGQVGDKPFAEPMIR